MFAQWMNESECVSKGNQILRVLLNQWKTIESMDDSVPGLTIQIKQYPRPGVKRQSRPGFLSWMSKWNLGKQRLYRFLVITHTEAKVLILSELWQSMTSLVSSILILVLWGKWAFERLELSLRQLKKARQKLRNRTTHQQYWPVVW